MAAQPGVTTCIGLLRAVNLAGHNRVSMTALRELLTDLGMLDVRTLVQSGNVVFRTRTRSPLTLEQTLERATADRLGVSTDYMVRTVDEWAKVIAGNPFPDQAKNSPNRLLMMSLKDAPERETAAAFVRTLSGPEMVHAAGRHVYIVYPDGVGQSRLSGSLIEKHLRTRGTARNWNTVVKLGALVGI